MREKGGLECGDLITVSIPSRNISRIIRIVSTEKNLKTGKLSCVVSNYLTEKWEDKIEGQISSMQATINGGGGMVVLRFWKSMMKDLLQIRMYSHRFVH